MSKVCYLCGKKTLSGNNVSHSHKKTKRKWLVNLKNYTLKIDGQEKKVKLCSKCIKAQNKL